jgi:hypothetical protein
MAGQGIAPQQKRPGHVRFGSIATDRHARARDKSIRTAVEERIVADNKCTNSLLDELRKGGVEVAFCASANDMYLLSDCAGRRLKVSR